jgi:hypothetical protein
MGELFKALSGGLWRFVYAWLLPSAITVSVFALVLFPQLSDLPVAKDISRQPDTARALILAFAALSVSVLLALNSVPLYRLLEGYTWPKSLYETRRNAHVAKWQDLKKKVEGGIDPNLGLLKAQLLWERYIQLPEREEYILPTRLGNALKALETYGKERYGLDSQTFWYELETVAPESLQKDVEDSRAIVDFFISFFYLAGLFCLLGVLIGSIRHDATSFVAGIVAGFLCPVLYLRAVKTTAQWQSAVRALVNVGRVKLATSFGLQIPATLEDERKMWDSLTSFVFWGDKESGEKLDQYRTPEQSDDEDVKQTPSLPNQRVQPAAESPSTAEASSQPSESPVDEL